MIVFEQLIMVDKNEFFFVHNVFSLIFLVEYLWNYMRNNQKPRSSVLRKKQGNSFSFFFSKIEIESIVAR